MNTKYYLAAIAVASLATVCVQAQTINGSVYEVSQAVANDAIPGNVPGGPAAVTFSTTDPINFESGAVPNGYTIGGFLSTGSGSTILSGVSHLGDTMDGTLFNFTGSVTVTTGMQFTAGHDDGLTLVIDGLTVISAPGPTSFNTTTDTYTGPSGTFAFQLVYGECCGAPADLEINLPFQSSVPDSASTLAMLGGSLTMMGMVVRRFRK